MKLTHLTSSQETEPGRIAYNAAMYVAVEEHDNSERLVCRPRAHLLNNEEFLRLFAEQGKVTEAYTSNHCLRYMDYDVDERGPYWVMFPGKYTSLAKLLIEKPSLQLEEKWVDSIVSGILESANYVHSFQHYLLELTPHSILVAKDGKKTVTLLPPLQEFIPIKQVVWPKSDEALAPELFNIEQPDQRADLYGIGRIIEVLHPYPSLPYKYSKVVKRVTCERVDTRPISACAMQSSIAKRGKGSAITHIIISISVVLAFVSLLLFYPWSDENEHKIEQVVGTDSLLFDDRALSGGTASGKSDSYDPLVNTDITSATDAEKERMLEQYLDDETYMSMDTAVSLSPEMKAHQRQMMVLAAEKFRTAYKMQVRPILTAVYTKENMESQEKFMRASNLANKQLLNIQESMCKQYQLDPTTATRISGEVIDEVADALKKKL